MCPSNVNFKFKPTKFSENTFICDLFCSHRDRQTDTTSIAITPGWLRVNLGNWRANVYVSRLRSTDIIVKNVKKMCTFMRKMNVE